MLYMNNNNNIIQGSWFGILNTLKERKQQMYNRMKED